MAHPRLSVTEAVKAAIGFWGRSWRSAAAPLAMAAVSVLLYSLALDPRLVGIGYGLYIVAAIMAQGALYRVAFAGRSAESPALNGPGGLQWRRTEWRLLGVMVLMYLLMLLVLALMSILLASVVVGFAAKGGAPIDYASPAALAEAVGPTGRVILGVVFFGAVLLLVWASMRLSLALAATAAEGRIRLLSTWGLTRGAVWPIFLSYFIASLPIILVSLAAGAFAQFRPDPQASARILSAAAAAVGVVFYLPVVVGLLSHIYLRLSGQEQTQ